MNFKDYALELIDEGELTTRDFAIMCVRWMTSIEIEDMLEANELLPRQIAEEECLADFMTRNA